MNLNHLALFHAVAQAGSFSGGADRLGISQPAVSKQIAELERNLKVRLFDRLPRGIRLTEAGELLAGYARQLFGLAADAERALAELRGLERGRLAVGASTTIGSYWLPGVLAEFHRAYPGIEVSLEIANTGTVQRMLIEGVVDVGLTEGFVDAPELDARVFLLDELVAIAPRAHPLARARGVSLKRLCEEPLVVREAGSGTRSVIERELSRRGLAGRPVMVLGGTEAIKQAVAAGVGVAIVSRLAIPSAGEPGKFAIVDVRDLSLKRPLHLVQLRVRHPGRALAAFLAMLPQMN
jgi:DNA-binding transcriptional LysR family regulator